MKRRNFIAGLLALSTISIGASEYTRDPVYSEEFKKKRADRRLFQRFFKVATTFDANPMQMFWYDQYAANQFNSFSGRRQTGQTTFMLVLALFEKKCLGTRRNVILCSGHGGGPLSIRKSLAIMEERLGMSTLDGQLDVCFPNSNRLRGMAYDKSFIMDDASINSNRFRSESSTNKQMFALCYAKKHMFFGTYENTYEGYFYAPYIPITYCNKIS